MWFGAMIAAPSNGISSAPETCSRTHPRSVGVSGEILRHTVSRPPANAFYRVSANGGTATAVTTLDTLRTWLVRLAAMSPLPMVQASFPPPP